MEKAELITQEKRALITVVCSDFITADNINLGN